MTRNLFVVTFCVHLSHSGSTWQAAYAITFENPVHACIWYSNAVIPRQIPNNSDRSEMILLPQVENFFFNLIGCFISWVYRYRLLVFEPCFSKLFIPALPSIECRAAYPKIPAGLCRITAMLGVAKYFQFTSDLSFVCCVYTNLLWNWILQEVSHQSRHIYNRDNAACLLSYHCDTRQQRFGRHAPQQSWGLLYDRISHFAWMEIYFE